MATVYSFPDIKMTIVITGVGTIYLGSGAGHMEGGISIAMVEDKNTMTVGADGQVMHSLHSGKAGIVTVRLLKTAPVNGTLSDAYYVTTASGRAHGRGTIHIKDISKADGDGDNIDCYDVAFAKFADVNYAKEGGEMVWTFHCGRVHHTLGPVANYNGELTSTSPDI
jgi:hypothetical protein